MWDPGLTRAYNQRGYPTVRSRLLPASISRNNPKARERLLEEHPPIPGDETEDQEPLRPFCPPDCDAILEEERHLHPDSNDAIRLAKWRYEARRGAFEAWYNHALSTQEYIDGQLWMFQLWPQRDLGALDHDWG